MSLSKMCCGKGTLAEVLGDKELDPAITGEDILRKAQLWEDRKLMGNQERVFFFLSLF